MRGMPEAGGCGIMIGQRKLSDLLWPESMNSRTDVYALLDGARDARVYAYVQASYLDKFCLYAGDLPQELAAAAPWLVRLEQGNDWTQRIIADGWENSWGVFLRTETSSRELRKHFRKFLRVRDPGGRILIFRYYDPRILRLYLPTCTPSELTTFFGPVQQFLVEDSAGSGAMEFALEGNKLRQTPLLLIDAKTPS